MMRLLWSLRRYRWVERLWWWAFFKGRLGRCPMCYRMELCEWVAMCDCPAADEASERCPEVWR